MRFILSVVYVICWGKHFGPGGNVLVLLETNAVHCRLSLESQHTFYVLVNCMDCFTLAFYFKLK